VGTAKRERQKANRQHKLEELAKQERSRKVRRRVLQFGVLIPVLVIVVFGAIWILGDDDDADTDVAATTTPVTAPVTTTPLETTTVASTVPPSTLPPLPCPAEDGSSIHEAEFPSPPPMCIDLSKVYLAEVETNKGAFTIELDPGIAPQTVNNFVYLARYHFFDDTDCHRIIPGFVVQCGDPTVTGSGGPGYEFADELPDAGAYQLGSVAMANSGPDTNGSQFFIVTGDNGVQLPPNYSLFGQVTEGFDTTVKAMEAAGTVGGTPSEPVTIISVTITEKEGAVATPTTTVATATTTTVAAATTVPAASTSTSTPTSTSGGATTTTSG
jgi:cyclophilin family peptidyl-prolyl cis-trans isomerase